MKKQNVLVAIDDEKFGTLVVDFVRAHKWPAGTIFKVMHVVEPPPPFDFPAPYWELAVERSLAAARLLVGHAAKQIEMAVADCLVEEKVLEGYPQDQLLRIARDWPCDLVVLGSHGRQGLVRAILGSVSCAVASQCSCSVVVIRPATGDAPAAESQMEASKARYSFL